VVWGHDGLDEVSPYGPSSVTEVSEGKLREFVIRPEDFGVAPSAPGATAGDSAQFNADALTTVLSGAPHAARDAFLLNAAAALVVALELTPKQALERARQAVDSKAALGLLERWRAAVQAAAAH
jgi:anthranilate phosphoribosyltransferase